MHHKEGRLAQPFPIIEECRNTDLLVLKQFLGYMNSSYIIKECNITCKYLREKTEYFCVRRECEDLGRRVLAEGVIPYSIHFYLGRRVKKGFEPSLQLGWEIVLQYKKRGGTLPHTVILRGYDKEKFTYGKSVRLKKDVKEGVVLVLTKEKEFLGWGQVSKRTLYPLIEIGWYLRKGG